MIEALLFEWGTPPSSVNLSEFGECEIISFYNNFSTNAQTELSFSLRDHQIIITQGSGQDPDKMFVIPRAGTTLDQESITIDEFTEGRITACPVAMF